MGITRSASTGCSRASCRPISTRDSYTERPEMVVSGRARYTNSNTHPAGWAGANRCDRSPSSSMMISSPGSTSRTKEAPTISSAAVSEATTQPRSKRPSTSGRTPCGSRAAYRVVSSMNVRQNAPRRVGSKSSTASSSEAKSCSAKSAVTRAVSVVLPCASSPNAGGLPPFFASRRS